jgi:hypothetical protein
MSPAPRDTDGPDRPPGALGQEPSVSHPAVAWMRVALAWPVLVLAVLLPLRWRVRLAELLGWSMDRAYGSYLGLLRWLMGKLREEPHERS